MIELINGCSSSELTQRLLIENNIFVKDLNAKYGFENRQFIRIAVRNTDDNNKLIEAIKMHLMNLHNN